MDVMPILSQLTHSLPAEHKVDLQHKLAVYLNDLLLHDFPALVQLLYKADVPEKKLKAVLQQNPTADAGNLLADLLIQRQREKIETKKRFGYTGGASDEERW